MQNGLLSDHQNGRLQWFRRGVAVNSILSTAFTYNGAQLLQYAADWYDKAIAAGVATASGVMIFLIWLTLFRAVADERTPAQLGFAILKILAAIPPIAAASTWLMVAGFAKDDAGRTHMQNYLVQAQTVTTQAHRHALLVGDFQGEIGSLAADLKSWGKLEEETGFSTGAPGAGAVSGSLYDASDWLTRLNADIAKAVVEVEKLRETAAAALADMRGAASAGNTAAERWQLFARHDEAWRAAVARLDTRRTAQAAVRTLTAAARDFGAVVKLSDNRSLRARQQAALDKYRALLAARVRSIVEGIEKAEDAEAIEMPVLERLSVVLAVLTYWNHYIAFWILGLGIDFAAPLIMLLSLHGAGATRTEQEKFASELLGMPTRNLLMAEYFEHLKRRIALDEHSAQSINDKLIGRDESDATPVAGGREDGDD